MKKPSTIAFITFTALYTIALATIFWGSWSPSAAFIQPDQPIHHPVHEISSWLHSLCTGGRFIPFDLHHLLGGGYIWQELQYSLATYLAALGMAYYLRGRRLSLLAQYGAGAIYAFMGYNFTLYSAGHLGFFIFLMAGPWAFGLIDRAVRKNRLRHWLLLGATLAWASAQQPDIWMLFVLLMSAYGIWCCFRERTFLPLLPKAAAAFATMLVVGMPQFIQALGETAAGREAQIASMSPSGEVSAADRWKFCTEWSLPPEDILEFAFPDIHGISSDSRISPSNPYRGRLGMQIAPGKWAPYRQHSLYFGFLTWALLAAAAALRLRKTPPSQSVCSAPGNRGEMIFWACAAFASLIAALGCFTPFYKIIYLLPYGSSIRCPVKFVHLVEWCVAALAGFAIHYIASRRLHWAKYAALAIVLANVIDLARVDSHYFALDPCAGFYRAQNDAAQRILSQGGSTATVLLPANSLECELFRNSFEDRSILQPKENAIDAAWFIASVRDLSSEPLSSALKRRDFSLDSLYTISLSKGIRKTSSRQAPFALLRNNRHTPQPPSSPSTIRRIVTFASILSSLSILAFIIRRATR